MACQHVLSPALRPPRANESVYREDCTQCFGSIDDPAGLDVCLTCFNGGCQFHGPLHYQTSSHPLVLNIKRTRRPVKRDEPPKKISKLAISAETEEDIYSTHATVKCYADGLDDIPTTQGNLSAVVDGVLKASTFARQAEVKAWEQEFTACEHTLCLEQEPPRQIESQDLGHCSMCELNENLWLCLTCGNLGCGRAQFGGVGGNGHGVAHTASTNHPVAVKLGSITPEGTADVYCYACNEERIDPELAGHLAHWGINIAEREKTEKSLTELQIEQNLKWDFSMTTEDGKELRPLFGQGFTGLKNLGNSCYLASTVQCLFSLPAFQHRYYLPDEEPISTQSPAEDLETQLRKMADGLLSGIYSKPDTASHTEEDQEQQHQKGLAPAMLKHLVGKGHEEFSTMRQQDAFELLLHLLKLITRTQHPAQLGDPVQSFRFVMEQRLQCISCKKVRYRLDEQDNISVAVPVRRLPPKEAVEADTKPKDEFQPVTFRECLEIFTGTEKVELTCPSCNSKDGFLKRSLFKTLPSTFIVNARRIELVNWVPTKLDIPVLITDEVFQLDDFLSPGHQSDEELLPEDSQPAQSQAWTANEAALAQLEAMGFPRIRCEKALHATGNSDAEAAMNWLFGHMDDANIDEPISFGTTTAATTQTTNTSIDAESMAMLESMGIPSAQARKALRETNNDITRAIDWVFSHPDDAGDGEGVGEGVDTPPPADPITDPTADATAQATNKPLAGTSETPASYQISSLISHKGTSIHAGHYVAFIRKLVPGEEARGRQWVLFNDEKVVKAVDGEEMKKFAYVYFFERVAGAGVGKV